MSRSILLNFLQKFNSDNDLSTDIWGESAAEAVKQALLHSGISIQTNPSFEMMIVAEHFQETPLAQRTLVGGNVADLVFPIASNSNLQNSTKLARVKNVTLRNWNGYHIVESESKLVSDLSSVYAPISLIKPVSHTVEIDSIDVGFLLFHDTDPNNYCHFILDVLSRCYLLGLLQDKPILIFPEFSRSRYHEFFFTKLFDFGFEFKFINENEFCHINTLYAVTLGGRVNGHPVLNNNRAAINYLNNFVSVTSRFRPATILWVSRKSTRRVLEEEVILDRLSSFYEVTVSNLEGLNVEQQANLFNEHQIIVGPHGAAFTNIVFQNKSFFKRVLLEIFCKNNGTAAYSLLAHAKECAHYSYVGKSIPTSHPNYPNISVDVDDFVGFFSETVMANII